VAERPPALAEPCAHRVGDVTAVERLRAVLSEPDERIAELGVAQQLALAQHPSLGRPQRRALGCRLQQVGEDLHDVGLPGVEHHAVARQLRRGCRQLSEIDRPPAPDRLAHSGGCPIHPARGRSDVEHLSGVSERHVHRIELSRAPVPRPRGGLHEEVEQRGLLPASRHHHVSPSPEPGQERLRGKRRQHRAHGCIHRIATAPQHLRPGLRRKRMPRRHNPLLSRAHT
jgi:hypothetical protein